MLVRKTSETILQKSRSSSSLRKSLERLIHHLLDLQPKKSSDIFFQILCLFLTDLLMSDHILDKNKYRILFHQSKQVLGALNPNHSYLSQLDVTYKTPDLMRSVLLSAVPVSFFLARFPQKGRLLPWCVTRFFHLDCSLMHH
ncbi:ABC transporter membrane protein [Streptococcus pneumoniae]|nr:ABC transporter membrane protein [Streptococcus pneumoniae]